jgi:hypothetical protein
VGNGPSRVMELQPCWEDECPHRFDGERFDLTIAVPFAAELRLVDDRGRIASRRETGEELPLRAFVSPDWRYVSPRGWTVRGRRWFLEIAPKEKVGDGLYPITIQQELIEPKR